MSEFLLYLELVLIFIILKKVRKESTKLYTLRKNVEYTECLVILSTNDKEIITEIK